MAAAFQVHLASFYLKSQLQSSEREQAQHRIAPPRRSAQRLPPFRRVRKEMFQPPSASFLDARFIWPGQLDQPTAVPCCCNAHPFLVGASNSPVLQFEPPDRSISPVQTLRSRLQ